ncbi:hypothetical protein [Gimesia sp.]|uniref:hypothetical protein n=1 Tax=Gimesia sp. TaxID=2024833 RepID=UPI0032EAA166
MPEEKVWIGGAPANARQVKYTLPLDIESGQVMTAKIGLKSFSYTFPDGPLRLSVVAAFVSLWEEKALEITEFSQVSITDNLDASFTLTAAVPGVPFIVTILIGDGTNEKQTVSLVGDVTGGTFTLDFNGQETGNIAYDATAGAIQTEMEGLSNVEVGDVEVTGPAGGPWVIEFKGNLADTDVALLIADSTLLESTNEQQTISLASCSGGTFALGYGEDTTDPIAFNASAATIESELEALPGIGAGNVSVSGSGPWVVEFTGTLRGTNVDLITLDDSNLTGVLDATISETTPGGGGCNERWAIQAHLANDSDQNGYITLTGNASVSAGTWDLLIELNSSALSTEITDIPYDVTLAELQALIDASLADSDVYKHYKVFASHQLPSSPVGTDKLSDGEGFRFQFHSSLCTTTGNESPEFTIDSSGLTGGTYSVTATQQAFTGGGSDWGTSSGSWKFIIDGEATDDLSPTITVADLKTAIEGLSAVGAGNVDVFGMGSDNGYAFGGGFQIEFKGDLANLDTGFAITTSKSAGATLNLQVWTVYTGDSGTGEVQTLSISGSPVAGTFALSYGDEVTALLDYDSTAGEIETALETLSGISAADVSTSGGPLPGSDILITFAGSLGGEDVAEIEVKFGTVAETVQGGGDPDVDITTTQTILATTVLQESEGPNDWDIAANWDTGTLPEDGDTVRVPNGPDILYGLDQSSLSLALVIVEDSDTEIGLPRRTADDEIEYLPRFLKLSADKFIIGQGAGGGSRRINIEPVNTDAEIIVHDSLTGEDGEEAVQIRNVNSANTVTLLVTGGEVGIATSPKDEAYIKQITQRGGFINVGSDVGLGGIERTGGQFTSYQTTMNGVLTL